MIPTDDQAPATKSDVALAQTELRNDIAGIKTMMSVMNADLGQTKDDLRGLASDVQDLRQTMEKGFKDLNQHVDRVLTVVVNTDKRLTLTASDHEKRIVRLERAVA